MRKLTCEEILNLKPNDNVKYFDLHGLRELNYVGRNELLKKSFGFEGQYEILVFVNSLNYSTETVSIRNGKVNTGGSNETYGFYTLDSDNIFVLSQYSPKKFPKKNKVVIVDYISLEFMCNENFENIVIEPDAERVMNVKIHDYILSVIEYDMEVFHFGGGFEELIENSIDFNENQYEVRKLDSKGISVSDLKIFVGDGVSLVDLEASKSGSIWYNVEFDGDTMTVSHCPYC